MKRLLCILFVVVACSVQHLSGMYGYSPRQQLDYQVIEAIMASSMPELTKALNKNANPNVRNFMGDSALALAIKKNRPDMVRYLLNRGASMSNVDREGWTALEVAIFYNRTAIVDLLIAQGALVTRNHFYYARNNRTLCNQLSAGHNAQRHAHESMKQPEPS